MAAIFLLVLFASSAFAQCHVVAVNRPEELKPGQSLSLSISQLPEITIPEYQPVENIRQTLLQRIQEELQSTKYYSSVSILKPGAKSQTDLLLQAEITIVELGGPFVILTSNGSASGVQLHIALVSGRLNRNVLEMECLGSQEPGYSYKPKKLLTRSTEKLAQNLRETLVKLPKEIQNRSSSAPILATTEIAISESLSHSTELNRWSPWNYSKPSIRDFPTVTRLPGRIEAEADRMTVSATSAKSEDGIVIADIVTSKTAPFLTFNHNRLLNLRYLLCRDNPLTDRYGRRSRYIWGGLYDNDKKLSPPLNSEYISPGQLRVEMDTENTIAIWIRYDKRSVTLWNTDRIKDTATLTSSVHPDSFVRPLRVYNLTGQVSERRAKNIIKVILLDPKIAGEIHINNSALLIFPARNQDGSSVIGSLKDNLDLRTEFDGRQVTIKIDLSKLGLDSIDQVHNRKAK